MEILAGTMVTRPITETGSRVNLTTPFCAFVTRGEDFSWIKTAVMSITTHARNVQVALLSFVVSLNQSKSQSVFLLTLPVEYNIMSVKYTGVTDDDRQTERQTITDDRLWHKRELWNGIAKSKFAMKLQSLAKNRINSIEKSVFGYLWVSR